MSAAKTAGAAPKGRKKANPKTTESRPTVDRLIDAALDLAETQRWRDLSLPAIADAAGVPIGEAMMAVPSRLHILKALSKRIDRQMLESLTSDPLDGSTKDRLFDLLMRRFDALEGRQAALSGIAGDLMRSPLALACLGGRFGRSMALTLGAAGVETTGALGAARVKALGLIQMNAFRTWLKDTDPGLAGTMATLDKGLRRAEQLASGRRPAAPEAAAEA